MTLKAFQKPSSMSPDLEVLARATADYTQQLTRNPLLDGQLIQGIPAQGVTPVDHILGRPWVGYIVTYMSVATDVSATRTNTDQIMIQLDSSAAATIDIWLF